MYKIIILWALIISGGVRCYVVHIIGN